MNKPLIDRYKTFDFMRKPVKPGELDVSHKTILYLEDVSVSFDGFKALTICLYI